MNDTMKEQRNFKWWHFAIIILLILVIGYLVYGFVNKKDDSKKEETPVPTATATPTPFVEQNLDINSAEVQELYKPIQDDDQAIQYIFWDKDKLNNITASTMQDKHKVYIGYRMLALNDFKDEPCSEHQSLETSGKNGIYRCGNNIEGVGQSLSTKVFSEEAVKNKVEKYFGPNSYKRVDNFYLTANSAYLFDYETNEYVWASFSGGGVGPKFVGKLTSAKKLENSIEIIENIDYKGYNDFGSFPNFNKNLKHTFTLNADGNYYYSNTIEINE